jgi:hypothetical protein
MGPKSDVGERGGRVGSWVGMVSDRSEVCAYESIRNGVVSVDSI